MELNSEFLCDWLDPEGFEVVYAENLKQIDYGHYVVQGQAEQKAEVE